jgi:catalase
MNNPPVLAVSTPEAFYDQVLASTPVPATGKPDPARLQAFAAHPESAAFRQWAAGYKPSDSFASTAYNSINAFRLIDAHGNKHPVRWRWSHRRRSPPCPPRSMTSSSSSTTSPSAWRKARCAGPCA